MKYSMKSHNRKNHQRWLNRACRVMNKNIHNDWLWLVVEQKATAMAWFEDGSGGLMYCHLQFRDKKTGRTRDWYCDCLDVSRRLWYEMNKFITEDCRVWEENPDPRHNVINFREVK